MSQPNDYLFDEMGRYRPERRTLPEALDAAKSPQEFGAVLGGLFTALERAMDAEREADDDQA